MALIPATFNFDEWCGGEVALMRCRDQINDTFDYILWKRYRRKCKGEVARPVAIKAAYMRKRYIGREGRLIYPVVMTRLVDTGWLTCDWKYRAGHKCYHYDMGPLYNGHNRNVNLSPRYVKRLAAGAVKHDDRKSVLFVANKGSDPVYRFVHRGIERVRLDRQAVTSMLDGLSGNKLEAAHRILDAFYSQPRYMRIGSTGRLFTSFTALFRRARECMSVDGDDLVTIDVANCQVLLLANSLQATLDWQDGHPVPDHVCDPECAGFRLYLASKSTDHADVARFKRDCELGLFWQHVSEQLAGPALTKREFKQLYMEFCFGKRGNPNVVAKSFKQLYPTAWRYLWWLKRYRYKNVARSLQRIESQVMIRGVAGGLMLRDPDMTIITIHDAIMTTQDCLDTVQDEIVKQFGLIGCNVTVKRE